MWAPQGKKKLRWLFPSSNIWLKRLYKLEGNKAPSVFNLPTAASGLLEGHFMISVARTDVALAATEMGGGGGGGF